MALFARFVRFGRKPPKRSVPPDNFGVEMFDILTAEEAEQATREYLNQRLDSQNAKAIAQARARDNQNAILEEDWQLVSKDGKQVQNLEQQKTAEFSHFLDHQFDEASFEF